MTGRSWLVSAGLLVLLLLLGCDEVSLHKVTKHFDLFFPNGETQKDTFTQKAAAKVDVLWMVDNSPSIMPDQTNLANNFDAFTAVLQQSSVDYQMAVITTDMDSDTQKGRFQGNPKIIRSTDANPKAEFAANVKVGSSGAGNEQGMAAVYAALSEPLIDGENSGFLRTGASLAVIYVSDEDDKSFDMVTFYQRFLQQIKGVGNEHRVMAGAIAGDEPDGCKAANGAVAAVGRRYHQLVQAVGGVIGSICDASFATTLGQMGLTVAGLDRKFTLSDPTIDPNSITGVTVNGTAVQKDYQNGWSFDSGSIFFNGSYVPQPGATIVVSYAHAQRQFTLTQKPVANDPGNDITVTVYAPGSKDCTSASDCVKSCGLAAKCDGGDILYNQANGWVLEQVNNGTEQQYIVSFEGLYFPPSGSTVQVVYSCDGGCKTP